MVEAKFLLFDKVDPSKFDSTARKSLGCVNKGLRGLELWAESFREFALRYIEGDEPPIGGVIRHFVLPVVESESLHALK